MVTEKATDAVAGSPRRPAGGWATAQPWLTTAARIGLAVVLAWAGWAKARQPVSKQELAVEAYRLVPDSMITAVGVGLPILELALAALLLAGFATRLAGGLGGLLMIIFIAGIISAWARGLKIDCGCFGGGGAAADPHYLREILRDTGFLAIAAWIAVWPRSRFAVDRLLGLYKD